MERTSVSYWFSSGPPVIIEPDRRTTLAHENVCGPVVMNRNCTLAWISPYCTSNSAMLHFNFKMRDKQTEQEFSGARVALGITGGIAAYKAIEVLRGLQQPGCEVRVRMTKQASEFVQPLTFPPLSGADLELNT